MESRKIDLQKAFEQNLKFISATEINVETVEKQFVKTNNRFYLTVGKIDCPTGRIVVSDPLCYLQAGKYAPMLDVTIPVGIYPVEVAICRNEHVGIRMCTVRLKITESKAVKYNLAYPTKDTAIAVTKEKVMAGFPVEAGMMSFCDEKVAKEYQEFVDNFYKVNGSQCNIYDDYFAKKFKESYEKLPAYQREEGDFIEWTNPNSQNKMVMVASGFGDGFYQSYWGYDKNNEICELIVPLINPDLFE